MNALIRNIVFSEDCNHYVSSMLRQARFLEQLLIRLDSEPKQIEEHLEQLRALITSPDNLTVHLSVNVKELAKVVSNPERVWATVVPPGRDGRESSSIKMRPPFDYVVPISECKTPSVIAGLGSVESAYLIQGVSCVKSHLHEDLAPIMVYIQFLIQMEGPMWRQIRGLGLSYHYSMYVQPDTGMLYFLLARSTHIVNAYKEGKDIVMNYVNGVTEFTDIELESAKSSLTFLVIEKETTVSDVAHHSVLAYLRDIPHSYNKDLLSKISRVTLEDLRRVGKEYISALFDETRVRRAVVCNQAKVNEVTETFKELQVPLHVIPSLEDDMLCSY
ncbi:hypothetical protein DPMN_154499 [Dreissena polymorpha]|uniref:Peptidase M16 C-terminal domain-containing protein n=3 Tax=Dreissena polymorpha TaxID=45954 RepID=A0A9D4J5S5_DREPO|nr:hypothetical protein DPMN_154499 [Dreissena polymorpha]